MDPATHRCRILADPGVMRIITGVEARGVLGFIYRTFGSSNSGNACLKAYEAYFEMQAS